MRGRLRTAIPNTDHLTRFTKYNALLAKVNLLKTRCIENSDAMTFLITLLTEISQVKLLGLVLASVTNTGNQFIPICLPTICHDITQLHAQFKYCDYLLYQ